MVTEIYELTGFQRDLLYIIPSQEKPSGQYLRDELNDYLGRDITHGQLYPNLDTLVDAELVTKGQIDRRTNFYTVSEMGIQAILNRREWEDNVLNFLD